MYVDLVLCKHDGNNHTFLFYAPRFSYLKEGERVIVDTQFGKSEATVVDSISVEYKSAEYNFIIKSTGATVPLCKVLSRVIYREFEYDDEMEESENGIDNDKE